MHEDEFQLTRFLEAQQTSYATALEEIKAGKKRTHWIWYVFPQLKGLGTSSMSQKFGVSSLTEARRYLAHTVLGARLRESTEALLTHSGKGAEAVLGELDASKARSCLTLFSQADPTAQWLNTANDRLYCGHRDQKTLELLRAARNV